MSSLLSVGVIGLGRMGASMRTTSAHRVPNARLVAVADQKANLREQFAGEFGGIKVYANHLDLLHDPGVEAVAIVTSTSTHKEVVMDAAACGKAIFARSLCPCRWPAPTRCSAPSKRPACFSRWIPAPFRCRIHRGEEESGRRRHRNSRGNDLHIRDPFRPRWSSAIRR